MLQKIIILNIKVKSGLKQNDSLSSILWNKNHNLQAEKLNIFRSIRCFNNSVRQSIYPIIKVIITFGWTLPLNLNFFWQWSLCENHIYSFHIQPHTIRSPARNPSLSFSPVFSFSRLSRSLYLRVNTRHSPLAKNPQSFDWTLWLWHHHHFSLSYSFSLALFLSYDLGYVVHGTIKKYNRDLQWKILHGTITVKCF